MKVLDIVFALVLIAFSVWGIRRALRRRHEERVAAAHPEVFPLDEPPPPLLGDAGFTEAIASGERTGARGVFDGVTVQALGREVTSGGTTQTVYTFVVVLPPELVRARVSAWPQGMRRRRRSLVLGLPGPDARLDVEGERDDALALFGLPTAKALVDAIAVSRWHLVHGELVRDGLTLHALGATARAGAAAAHVLEAFSAGRSGDVAS